MRVRQITSSAPGNGSTGAKVSPVVLLVTRYYANLSHEIIADPWHLGSSIDTLIADQTIPLKLLEVSKPS
jgi:hypothetical protein